MSLLSSCCDATAATKPRAAADGADDACAAPELSPRARRHAPGRALKCVTLETRAAAQYRLRLKRRAFTQQVSRLLEQLAIGRLQRRHASARCAAQRPAGRGGGAVFACGRRGAQLEQYLVVALLRHLDRTHHLLQLHHALADQCGRRCVLLLVAHAD